MRRLGPFLARSLIFLAALAFLCSLALFGLAIGALSWAYRRQEPRRARLTAAMQIALGLAALVASLLPRSAEPPAPAP